MIDNKVSEEFRDTVLKIIEELSKKYNMSYNEILGELAKIFAYVHAMSCISFMQALQKGEDSKQSSNKDIYG